MSSDRHEAVLYSRSMKNKNEHTVQTETPENRYALSAPDLWARILPWRDRLASDEALTTRIRVALAIDRAAASDAILEYLRFAYLAWISPTGATPSKAVDEVWHAHLLFTRSYGNFCLETRGQLLHHEPGEGVVDEAHFRDAYRTTLDLYRAEFGEPPGRWWPQPAPVVSAVGSSDAFPSLVLLLPGIFLTAMAWKFLGAEVGLLSTIILALIGLILLASSTAPASASRKRDRGGGSCDGGGGLVAAEGGGGCPDGGGGGGGESCGGASCGSGCGGGGCGGG
jgi:hypothetical protein